MPITGLLFLTACAGGNATSSAETGENQGPWEGAPVDVRDGWSLETTGQEEYTPLDETSEPWNICLSIPHMRDSYWLGAVYGATEQARDLNVNLNVVDAGGYENLSTQIEQIEDCSQAADAVVIAAISYDGVNSTIDEIVADDKPVIDVVNGISSEEITAKSLVSFKNLGQNAADWLVDQSENENINVLWFPGPSGAAWAEDGNTGFTEAIEDTNIELLDTRWGDTGREVQSELLENALAASPDVDYIVSNAVGAEAAVPILRDQGLSEDIGIVSYYPSSGTFQGVQAKTIQATNSDAVVVQARVAVDQAVRALEGEELMTNVGPELVTLDESTVDSYDRNLALAPDNWEPIFNVSAE